MNILVNSLVANVDFVSVLLPIALILIACKSFSILCQKFSLPQVIGYLVAGLLLSLINLIPGQKIFTQASTEGLSFIAKIGVILKFYFVTACITSSNNTCFGCFHTISMLLYKRHYAENIN